MDGVGHVGVGVGWVMQGWDGSCRGGVGGVGQVVGGWVQGGMGHAGGVGHVGVGVGWVVHAGVGV